MIDRPELVDSMISGKVAVGTENLMNVLKNYARIAGTKTK
jgi:hypothetical protein